MTIKGIDISKYQQKFNLKEIPADIQFIILRAGYRGWGTGKLTLDPTFKNRFDEIRESNKGLGVYFFSQAKNYQEGVEEAIYCLKNCNKNDVDYGFYFDSEIAHYNEKGIPDGRADNISKFDRTQAARGFIDTIRNNGGRAGIYASSSWFNSHLDMSKLNDVELWVADYRGYCGYKKNMIMWQYTSQGTVNGVGLPNKVDMNYCYKRMSDKPINDMPPESIFKIGPASKGDIKALIQLSQSLLLTYKIDDNYIIIGPMSKGDKVTVYNKAASLSLPIKGFSNEIKQKCIWKMDYLRITQKYGIKIDGIKPDTYSHAMTNALDLGGKDAFSNDFVYAPFDCIVKKVYPSYNTIFVESTKPVVRLDGKETYLTMQLTHINDSDLSSLGIIVGKTFKQGEIFYREGKKGASGAHVHVAIGEGTFSGNGWDRQSNGNNCIKNPLFLHKIAWLDKDTKVLDGGGYKWIYENGSIIPVTPPKPPKPQTNKQKYLKINSGSWNIRSQPNTSGKVIKVIKGSNFYKYFGLKDNWYKLEEGYIGPAAVKQSNFIKIKSGNWNVRKGPSTSTSSVKTISGNRILEYFDIQDGWFKIGNGQFIGPAAVEDQK